MSLAGLVLFAAIYGILEATKKEEDEDDDDGSTVKPSVKRQLLKADRALMRNDYSKAEAACHRALALLANSKHAEKQLYLEARAVTMAKVHVTCIKEYLVT
jgi:hypothetical protein